MKRLIGIILSLIIVISCTTPISVQAKVIEPEVVKTESWTTSYYIDDDMDTLYPYIQCEADIYNDGTIKLYMWNTHEWDGFATVSHKATIINTKPVWQNSWFYTFWKNDIQPGKTCAEYLDTYGTIYVPSTKDIYSKRQEYYPGLVTPDNESNQYLKLNLSFFSDKYSISDTRSIGGQTWGTGNGSEYYYAYNSSGLEYPNWEYSGGHYYLYLTYNGALPKMKFYTNSTDARKQIYEPVILKPTEDPTGTYNFRLFGHDITITPELLSGNIVAEPELTEQEKYIKQLEEENAKLKASITNTNSFGDINGDSLVDVADAQMILNYYVYTLVNSNVESFEEWISKQ